MLIVVPKTELTLYTVADKDGTGRMRGIHSTHVIPVPNAITVCWRFRTLANHGLEVSGLRSSEVHFRLPVTSTRYLVVVRQTGLPVGFQTAYSKTDGKIRGCDST